VQVPVSILRRFSKDKGLSGIWRIAVDESPQATIDQRPEVRCAPLQSSRDLVPNGFYVLSPIICAYDSKRGLLLGEPGQPFGLLPYTKSRKQLVDTSERESWREHSTNVLSVFYEVYEPRYRSILELLAKWWRLDYATFSTRCAFAIAMHDLGKLGREWQDKIGREPGEAPIGHTGDYSARNLPPHATVSAYALSNLFALWERLGDILQYTIAHHHSVRAAQVPRYQFVLELGTEVQGLLAQWPALTPLWQLDLIFPQQSAPTTLPSQLPSLSDARAWRTYVIVSRLLRFADRVATGGGEHVLFRYEDWLADV
jgi:CRISPR-associated endonuclease Cas3-HD